MGDLLGVHKSMPSAEYHSYRDFIGSSSIVKIDESPKHFHHAWQGPAKDPTAPMIKGTLRHSLLLEQDVSHYVARPLTDKGSLVASNTKDYAAFLAANPGKTPIHPADYDEMYEILTAFCENTRALAMMKRSQIEYSVFAQDPETGLLLKARPDIWGAGYMADLKTTSNVGAFERQIFQSMYDVRLAHYAKVIEYTTGEMIEEFFFIVVESSAPHCSKIYRMKSADMDAAKAKWRSLVNQVFACTKTGAWPGFADEIHLVEKPKFFADETISFDEVV